MQKLLFIHEHSALILIFSPKDGQSWSVMLNSVLPVPLIKLVTFVPTIARIHLAVHSVWNGASITCWYQRQAPHWGGWTLAQSRPLNEVYGTAPPLLCWVHAAAAAAEPAAGSVCRMVCAWFWAPLLFWSICYWKRPSQRLMAKPSPKAITMWRGDAGERDRCGERNRELLSRCFVHAEVSSSMFLWSVVFGCLTL